MRNLKEGTIEILKNQEEKKSYTAPHLVFYGSAATLTQGASGGGIDINASATPPCSTPGHTSGSCTN